MTDKEKLLPVVVAIVIALFAGNWILRVFFAALGLAFKIIVFVLIVVAIAWLIIKIIQKFQGDGGNT